MVVTHGVVKQVSRIPTKEVKKAIDIRNEYFRNKKEPTYEIL